MIYASAKPIPQAVLQVCQVWAKARSKDPNTQVGAAIYDEGSGGLFLGYNGFPANIEDKSEWWDRRIEEHCVLGSVYQLTKYDLVVHAEVNAVRKALLARVKLCDCTLYCTHLPCPQCFKDVVLSNGIYRVAYLEENYSSQNERNRWLTRELAKLAEVELIHMGV